jgi:hypothetical protein
MFSRRSRRWLAPVAIFSVALILRLAYWAYKGTWRGGDWGGYSAACDLWATDPIGIVTAHKGIQYVGFTGPFCAVQSVPGATADTWVAIQITLSAFACVLVYWAAGELVDDRAGVVAGLVLASVEDTSPGTS